MDQENTEENNTQEECEDDNSEPEQEPEPSMFDYMYERIPTENEFGLLLQACI